MISAVDSSILLDLITDDPGYADASESLLEKALSFYPEEEREKLLMNRRRPRRRGKPL
jgi:hypothetical protein